ncbi:MAG: hypothetical protein AB8B55_12400 [Mariniblastus sp.]
MQNERIIRVNMLESCGNVVWQSGRRYVSGSWSEMFLITMRYNNGLKEAV